MLFYFYKMINIDKIFKISNSLEFNRLAIKIYNFQYNNNAVYRKFCNLSKKNPFNVKEIMWDKWAKKTENYSGAWLRELVTTAFSLSVQDRKANNQLVLTDVHMNRAYNLVTESRNKANNLYAKEEELETSYY